MKEEVDIIIDTREKYGDFFAKELRSRKWTVRIKKLEAGDFMILSNTVQDSYLVERKDIPDFFGSMQGKKDISTQMWVKGRLWSQIQRMKESYDGQIRVLIEGNIYNKRRTAYKKTGMNKARIWGALEGIKKWGIGVHHTKDKEETVEYLHYLIQRANRPKREYPLRASAKSEMSLEDKKRYFIEGLPSIGPKAGKAVIAEYPDILTALKDAENWDKLKGIGKAGKEKIIEVLWTRN